MGQKLEKELLGAEREDIIPEEEAKLKKEEKKDEDIEKPPQKVPSKSELSQKSLDKSSKSGIL